MLFTGACSGTDGLDGEAGLDGQDGSFCSVFDNEDGTYTMSCEDGTEVTFSDGQDAPIVNEFAFPRPGDTRYLIQGTTFWIDGEYVEGTRELAYGSTLQGVALEVDLANSLDSCGQADVGVFVNGALYETITVSQGTEAIQVEILDAIPIASLEVTVRLELLTTVQSGCAAFDMLDGGTLEITSI
ncbi:hypothetical protein FRC98_16975 [Lujinxingia vulgaris]|uniref:Uncharacterized protein n=1 Tax=Lujinxingia vulgaris TaxID=2600176 RepID=A0A5C6X4G2_9DELT|nr:hypothetical protein [Lujinxingia vulgaris]TXD35164.1 hypothetical protein FRC98_16975 [Lujinxingia vulgaris]